MSTTSDLDQGAKERIGEVIRGKWRLRRVLGRGGMATVFEAEHRNGSRVAIKILSRGADLSDEQRGRFAREGYVANRVGHAGAVRVFDDDVDEHGDPFLVMELLVGQTVAERARDEGGRLGPDEVLHIADRLLDVLGSAHLRGIIHRDIKPQNVFLTRAGQLKVLDFGIARMRDQALDWSSTAAGTLLGTPGFVAPEQARGQHDLLDARSDLWAVGATMFKLLSGEFVHEATTANEQVGLTMTRPARSLEEVCPDLPRALTSVVDRALAFEPEARFQSAAVMRDAVQRIRARWYEFEASPKSVLEDFPLGPADEDDITSSGVSDEYAPHDVGGAGTLDEGVTGDRAPSIVTGTGAWRGTGARWLTVSTLVAAGVGLVVLRGAGGVTDGKDEPRSVAGRVPESPPLARAETPGPASPPAVDAEQQAPAEPSARDAPQDEGPPEPRAPARRAQKVTVNALLPKDSQAPRSSAERARESSAPSSATSAHANTGDPATRSVLDRRH